MQQAANIQIIFILDFSGTKLDTRITLKKIFYLMQNTLLVDIGKYTNTQYNTIQKIKKKYNRLSMIIEYKIQ